MATKGWTIKFRPWSVIHTEYFNNKKMAMNREKQLKSAQGRAFIRSIIKP
jgi:putative endonuclease